MNRLVAEIMMEYPDVVSVEYTPCGFLDFGTGETIDVYNEKTTWSNRVVTNRMVFDGGTFIDDGMGGGYVPGPLGLGGEGGEPIQNPHGWEPSDQLGPNPYYGPTNRIQKDGGTWGGPEPGGQGGFKPRD